MTGQQGQGEAERGDLGERQVDEDHLAQQHVQSEIAVHADQDEAGRERRRHEREHLQHRASSPARRGGDRAGLSAPQALKAFARLSVHRSINLK